MTHPIDTAAALHSLCSPIDTLAVDRMPDASASAPTAASPTVPTADAAPAQPTPWHHDRFDPSIRPDRDNPDRVWYGRASWESADTSRLNAAHWSAARDTPINDNLAARLHTMRVRSNHEAWNNLKIEGLILQHSIAVFGDDGPLLDLIADDDAGDRWCDEAERLWEDWCGYSDAAGSWTLGARMTNGWNRSCWVNGEWLDQLVYVRPDPGQIGLRLHAIEPQRLYSPISTRDPSVVLGIRRDAYRRPQAYHIAPDWYGYTDGTWLPADYVLHGYDRMEADQARGVPWAQSGLPTAADLRDYDDQVMDAARSAADHAVFVYTEHPDAPYFQTNETATYTRRRINHLAPGWKPGTLSPSQPGASYTDHRDARTGDLGLGRGVPSMITRLDARQHNYSSARFDRALLHESAKHLRATLYRPALTRLVSLVLAEAVAAGLLPPPPKRFAVVLVWPAMPQVDEAKSAAAERQYLANGTLPYSDACVERHGQRARDVIRRRERDARLLAAAGLPSVLETTSTTGTPAASSTDPDRPRT